MSQIAYILLGIAIGLPAGIMFGVLLVKSGLIKLDEKGNGRVQQAGR